MCWDPQVLYYYSNLLSSDLKSPEHLAGELEFSWHRPMSLLQLAAQGLLGESIWRRAVCLVSIYQFLVILGIFNVSGGN